MFKLLTEEEGRKVSSEYSTRRAIVILISIIVVIIVGIVGLLPSYVISNARQHEIIEHNKIIADNSLTEGNEDALNAWLEDINQKLETLSPALDKDKPSAFIDKILEHKTSGIVITEFSWLRIKDEIILSVSGVADNRQSLIMFENNINSSKYFSTVTLPVSNLAKDRDIDFQMKLSP